MVQFFGECMDGYVFIIYVWVQSYGFCCVCFLIIVGDIFCFVFMIVKESKYVVSIFKKFMKGMFIGFVICLWWFFFCDDVYQFVQVEQFVLVFCDEVVDFEKVGVDVIQVDEFVFCEGLFFCFGKECIVYFDWVVKVFKFFIVGVEDFIQIYFYFCYFEFQDFFYVIVVFDVDVFFIENSKFDVKFFCVFVDFVYFCYIGFGVYDIYFFCVFSEQEIKDCIEEMFQFFKFEQFWIDFDCGFKICQWKEIKEVFVNMVNVVKVFCIKYVK